MIPKEQTLAGENSCDVVETIANLDSKLILLKAKAKKNVDQTINTSDRYTSWFHYNTKNVDKYIQLCPHCKKPSLTAFDRTVIDSAVDYLNGKRALATYKTGSGNLVQSIIIMLAFSGVVYFLVSRI